MLPENEIDNIFPLEERDLIRTVLRHGKSKMGDLHGYLQRELNALKYG